MKQVTINISSEVQDEKKKMSLIHDTNANDTERVK